MMTNDECEEAKGLKLLLLEGVVKQAVMAERERWCSAIKGLGGTVHPGLSVVENLVEFLKREVSMERERCAKIAEGHYHHINSNGVASHGSQCLDYQCNVSIAKEIRGT